MKSIILAKTNSLNFHIIINVLFLNGFHANDCVYKRSTMNQV